MINGSQSAERLPAGRHPLRPLSAGPDGNPAAQKIDPADPPLLIKLLANRADHQDRKYWREGVVKRFTVAEPYR